MRMACVSKCASTFGPEPEPSVPLWVVALVLRLCLDSARNMQGTVVNTARFACMFPRVTTILVSFGCLRSDDGFITGSEFRDALRRHGCPAGVQDIDALFKKWVCAAAPHTSCRVGLTRVACLRSLYVL